MTRVSVVIPVHNDEIFLDRCLRHLAEQSVLPAEIIIVDNASTDGSAAVARAHGARVVEERRVGIPIAAATGYDTATGDIIARCDADSIVGPNWISTLTQALAARPQAAAVTGWGWFYDIPGPVSRVLAVLYLGGYYALGGLACGHHLLWGSSMAIRRSAWAEVSDKVHRTNSELHDDMDLAFVLGPNAKIALVPSLLVGVSGRSVRFGEQWKPRIVRGFNTIGVNWREMPPWERWRHRLPKKMRVTARESAFADSA
ncbi:glycosyltransferase [Flaviflexus huanghaiensis]|uniref:glycosyltransferase n=1 Tax=Flaviflexus huanghaiensis TaxID=1111473 RepID=UPI0015FD5D69